MQDPVAQVCVFSNEMATDFRICLLFEHRVFSADWTKPQRTDYVSRPESCARKQL